MKRRYLSRSYGVLLFSLVGGLLLAMPRLVPGDTATVVTAAASAPVPGPRILAARPRMQELTPDELAILNQFLDALPEPPSGDLFVLFPPLPHTTSIWLAPPEKLAEDAPLVQPPATLTLFGERSALVWLDQQPGFKLSHPFQVGAFNLDTGEFSLTPSAWAPRIEIQIDGTTLRPEPLAQSIANGIPVTVLQFVPAEPPPVSKPPAPVPATSPTPKKMALVIDGGDEAGFFSIAAVMASDSERMGKALTLHGYQVQHYSNYAGNSHPKLETQQDLDIALRSLNLQPGDELFLFISAHGKASRDVTIPAGATVHLGAGIYLYSANGSGFSDLIVFSALDKSLKQFAPGVRSTVMIDACQSGEAITDLAGPGRTIITATDRTHNAPGGSGPIDSFGQDFLESGFETNAAVTIQAAFQHARSEADSFIGGGYNPQMASTPLPPLPPPSPTPAPAPNLPPRLLEINRIRAVFNQNEQSTYYSVTVSDPERDPLRYIWIGPDCGTVTPREGMAEPASAVVISMTWSHPHPPCDRSTDHAHVLIELHISDGHNEIVCTKRGASTGEGDPCVVLRP